MNERDKELADEAEAYADRDFKGEINWGEAYESKLIALIRADEREACADAVVQAVKKGLQAAIAMEREACAKVCDAEGEYSNPYAVGLAAKAIRARATK